MKASKFKKGDKVTAFGLYGVVDRVTKIKVVNDYRIEVGFSNGKSMKFYGEGKLRPWHESPTLFLCGK